MALPVVITAFAFEEDQQSREGHLDYLIEEKEKIVDILDKKSDQVKHIDIINPTPDKIIQKIDEYKNDLSIFHFSGHSNQEYLKTHEFKSRGEGIAGMMKECYALKLVVLNGCNTGGQVPFFIENDVPCVIGTSAEVGDMTAKNFAVSFYENFFEKCFNLEESFDKAINTAKTTKAIDVIKVVRSLGKKTDSIGEWILSSTDAMLKLNSEDLDETRAYQPNKRIFEVVIKLRKDIEAENNTIDFSTFSDEQLFEIHRDKFLNLFPLPIANQLQKLLSRLTPEEEKLRTLTPFSERIKQMLLTYQTITELTSAVLLAQLWDVFEVSENKLIVSDDLKISIPQFLNDLFDSTNKLPFFRQILTWFSDKKLSFKFNNCKGINDYFLNKIKNNEDKLIEATNFFKNIAASLTVFDEREARLAVQEAENHFAEWLDFSLILSRYRFLSIQRVNLLQYRDVKMMLYNCKISSFAGTSSVPYKIGLLDYTTANSVILIDKDAYKTTNLKNYLNLSPFLIDSIVIDERKAVAGLYYPISWDTTKKGFQYKNITNLSDNKIYYINGQENDPLAGANDVMMIPTGTEEIYNPDVYTILENQINYFKKLFA